MDFLHARCLENTIQELDARLPDKPNIILYGARATGKKTMALHIIRSQSNAKKLVYKRNVYVRFSKREISLRISDMHIELDLSNILNNCRQSWDRTFETIKDITLASPSHKKFVLLHNIELASQDIINSLHAYLQNLEPGINLRFLLLTTSLIALPQSLIDRCVCFRLRRPSHSQLKSTLKAPSLKKEEVIRLETLYNFPYGMKENVPQFKYLIDMLQDPQTSFSDADIVTLRNYLYQLQIDKTNNYELPWRIVKAMVPRATEIDLAALGKTLGLYVKRIANAYRPIYHLETLALYLASLAYESRKCPPDPIAVPV